MRERDNKRGRGEGGGVQPAALRSAFVLGGGKKMSNAFLDIC